MQTTTGGTATNRNTDYWTWKTILRRCCDCACEECPGDDDAHAHYKQGRTPKETLDLLIEERCGG